LPIIATIPVHPGFENNTWNVDLYVDLYLHLNPKSNIYLHHLDHHGICITSFVSPARRKERWFWTIFMPYPEVRTHPVGALLSLTSWKRDTGVSEPWNNVYDSFKAGDGKNTVKGNIIIVKSDNKGIICDVLERDLGHIEWVVYQ
jgi:hypothetical protein